MAISFRTESAVTVFPQPDSPTPLTQNSHPAETSSSCGGASFRPS
jgi:hypothetical protein